MADNNKPIITREDYVKDPRIACKYGNKCYQKNPIHLQKFKHAPPKSKDTDKHTESTQPNKKFKKDPEITEPSSLSKIEHPKKSPSFEETLPKAEENNQSNNSTNISDLASKRTPVLCNPKEFIKEKFLVEMPQDFFKFWDFCKSINEQNPQEALKDVGLTLVGPYDVLAGKFNNINEQTDKENYLIHWRFFYDPPEVQTIIISKENDEAGFHIGYFRDSPKELPNFLVSNSGNLNGQFKIVGDNIFAAVHLYLEDFKKLGDLFKKMQITKFRDTIKKQAEQFQYDLSEKTGKIRERNKKIVARSNNKIGLVVPYNRKTESGYRDLGVSKKQITTLLDKIEKARSEEKSKFLSKLQDILTNINIATDECDFGTGIEFGLDILSHGIDSLNRTIVQCLATNYKLINREEFARIITAHMKNRKKATQLSII